MNTLKGLLDLQTYKIYWSNQMNKTDRTVKSAKTLAIEEVAKEEFDKNKGKYKTKLKELALAKTVVKNLEREIEDLDDDLDES
jgi:hypothetical protein